MADQVQRLVFLLKKFQTGHKFTTTEVYDLICKEFGEHSLRTVQRDMLLLKDSEPALTSIKIGKENFWFIPKDIRNTDALMRINSNEMLSFYILKAHLKTFTGTVIEDDVIRLADKIEKYAPDDVYPPDSIFWDQNIGYFDYSHYDSYIQDIIKAITETRWIAIDYNTSNKGVANRIIVCLRCLFTYSGALYTVGYVPKHDVHIALAVHNIDSIEFMEDYQTALPPFDFKDWTKNRFGVFYGDIRKVVLSIKKEYKHYFTNRRWHQSQTTTEEKDGTLTIEMKVPIGPDFISWIMGWGSAIVVKKPMDLAKQLIKNHEDAIANYDIDKISDRIHGGAE